MASDDLTLLLEMGFPQPKAEQALRESGNIGIEAAMEWLMNHEDDPPGGAPSNAASESDASKTEEKPAEAKSLKCNECNKLFKSVVEVEYHAAKSGHSDFSESTEEKKPLTEEEKKEQLRLLEEKMKQKRAEREEKEKAEQREREKRRIQSGKEMAAIKEKMRDDEAKKLVEQRRREKVEDEKARTRVRAQIEADKEARRAKAAGTTLSAVPTPTPVSTPVVPATPQKDYPETRLQIRLPNGQSITNTFGCKEQLSAVRLYIEMNRSDGNSGPFTIMTNFPKKVFSAEEYEMPLDTLGLVPSAVLIVTRQF